MEASSPQPLWSLVPASGRARYLRRAARRSSTSSTRSPTRSPTRSGSRAPRACSPSCCRPSAGCTASPTTARESLRDRRLGRIPALRGGAALGARLRRPLGVVGVRGGRASPWAEPVLETGAALLAGNAVVLSTPLGGRVRAAFERGGVPPELIALAEPEEDLTQPAATTVIDTRPPRLKGTMLVLDGAPLERTRHRRAVGGVRRRRPPPRRGRAARGRAVGRRAAAERASSPAPSGCTPATRAAATPRSARCARPRPASASRSSSATRSPTARRCCAAARSTFPASTGAFYAPAVLRGVKPGARLLHEPVPGPVLAVVEAESEPEAIGLAAGASAPSPCGRATATAASGGAHARGRGRVGQRARPLDPRRRPCGSPATSTPRRLASQPTRLHSRPLAARYEHAGGSCAAARRCVPAGAACRHGARARERLGRGLRGGGSVAVHGRRHRPVRGRDERPARAAVRRAAARSGASRSRSGSSGTSTRRTYSAPPCRATRARGIPATARSRAGSRPAAARP